MKSIDFIVDDFLNYPFQQVKNHEGFYPGVYTDTVGIPTIGYGFIHLTKPESEYILAVRLKKIHRRLMYYETTKDFYAFLDPVRQGVLINMAYNLDYHGLSKFKKMFYYIRKNDFEKASIEMLDSKWAIQVKRRAVQLAHEMRTGERYGIS